MLKRYYALVAMVPEAYQSMLNPQLDDILDKIKPVCLYHHLCGYFLVGTLEPDVVGCV